jgi:hypothetical protein
MLSPFAESFVFQQHRVSLRRYERPLNRIELFCFDAFSSREAVPIPDQVRYRLSLENAMVGVTRLSL